MWHDTYRNQMEYTTGFPLTREQLRIGEEVSQTLKLLTVMRPELIDKVARHIAEGVPATTLSGRVNCAQIYRAKNQYQHLSEHISALTEAASKLYAVMTTDRATEPFPIVVNGNKDELSRGLLWHSHKNGAAYRTADLEFFMLSGNIFTPYSIF